MTVCIAAVCDLDGRPVIIAISDRMITVANREFEPDQTKLVYFAERTLALLAGNMQFHSDVTPRAFENLRKNANPSNVTVREVAEAYAAEFSARRRERAAKEFLAPLDMTMDSFLTRQKNMLPSEVSTLRRSLTEAEIDAPAIITGVDRTGGHIFAVADPGEVHSFDMSNFCAIGLGDDVALSVFQSAGYEKLWPFPRALSLAYTAKKKAEVVVGVGEKTDIVVIRAGEPLARLTDEEIRILDDIYQEKVRAEDVAERVAVARLVEEIKRIAAECESTENSAKPQVVLEEDASVKDQIATEEQAKKVLTPD